MGSVDVTSLHAPAVAHHERLAGQRVRSERGEEESRFGHVLDRGELAVHGVLEHDGLDDLLFGDAELLRLLGDLLVDKRRAHKAGTDDIGAYVMLGAFFGDSFGKADKLNLVQARAFVNKGDRERATEFYSLLRYNRISGWKLRVLEKWLIQFSSARRMDGRQNTP